MCSPPGTTQRSHSCSTESGCSLRKGLQRRRQLGPLLCAPEERPEATEAGLAVRDPSTARLLRFAKQPLRSEFVTFSKLPKIDAANKAVTTTKSSKIQKSHKLSG